MRKFLLLLALSPAVLPAIAQAEAKAPADCSTILPALRQTAGKRPLTPEDLVRLRDIGPVEPETFAEPFFTISPDGRSAAFQLRRADPQRNSYCLAMVIVDLSGAVPPRVVDRGGEPLLLTFDFRGIADFPTGLMRVISPRWSRDGRSIAFLKRDGRTTQVWRAFVDGSASAPLTHSDLDVVDFAISHDGSSIIYAVRSGIDRQRRENEEQGLNGWHYDDRFVPFVSKDPLPRAPVEREAVVLDLLTGHVRPAGADEAKLVATDKEIIAVAGEPASVLGDGLEISATNLMGGAQVGKFHARLASGSVAACMAPACEGAMYPWRMPQKDHVGFLRSEGWGQSSTALYEWDLGTGKTRRLHATDDVLSSCAPAGKFLICLVDSSLEPRRLVKLDPVTGRRKTLFDPNPEFAHLTLGKAERLHWRNASGVETFGDLVLPVGYRSGTIYPLVIVQYDTRGFLRGGTDDEYPIQAFANRGYAVLSFSSPHFPPDLKAKDFEQAGRISLEQFAYRRNIQSSLEAGVKLLIDRGIADPKRIGITGLSDGSSTVEWALSHSSLFSAAALSSCCWDPTFVSRLGPGAARHFLEEGYPGILGRNDPFWKDMSLELNARRLSTPMLVNASEEEFLTALETFTGLREAGVPIDMFVYPGEYHGRWQPAHRLATYRRSLDWFDYWLRGVRSDAPDRQSELKEWDRLKDASGHGRPI
jgi:dipeptidyl aminopeptidase/acylaminoacyl peptidase